MFSSPQRRKFLAENDYINHLKAGDERQRLRQGSWKDRLKGPRSNKLEISSWMLAPGPSITGYSHKHGSTVTRPIVSANYKDGVFEFTTSDGVIINTNERMLDLEDADDYQELLSIASKAKIQGNAMEVILSWGDNRPKWLRF